MLSSLAELGARAFNPARAAEKDRIVPGPALADLLVDRFDEVACVKWHKTGENPQGLREEMNRCFRVWVKYGDAL